MRESTTIQQEPQEAGSTGASSRRCFQNSSSSPQHDERHIISPLKVEKTRGVGRSRSMIVEVSVQGKRSPHRRRGTLTFAVSINALPRAGASRRRTLDGANLEASDSTPHVPQRRRASIF